MTLVFAVAASYASSQPVQAETPQQAFTRVMTPLAGHWSCAGFDDVAHRGFKLTEQNAFDLGGTWFRSHEVDDRGVANDVITSRLSGGGKWRSLLLNDDGTYGIFTWDGAPVPSSWATAYLSATGKTQRLWLEHAFVNPNVFVYDIRAQDRGRLDRLEHGRCTRSSHPNF